MDQGSKTTTLAKKTLLAASWNYASFILGKAMVLITMAVLARILSPMDFGIVGIATLAIIYFSILQELCLNHALIQKREELANTADTVFTINLTVGVILTGFTYFMAPLVAGFFHEPRVTPLLQVLAFSFLLEPLGSAHLARLQRDLNFRRKLIPDLGRATVKALTGIGAALAGMEAWSLIIAQLAGITSGVILSWIVMPWRPRLRIDTKLARGLFSFSIPLVFVNVFNIVAVNADYTVVGHLLGSQALGIYLMAYRIPELTIISLWMVLASVTFPAFSSIQDQPEKLKRGFLTTIRYVQALTMPLSLGMVLAAEPLVMIMLGPKWEAVIPLLRLLAVYAMIGSIGTNAGDVYKAIGKPSILWKIGCINIPILITLLYTGAQYGLIGVAIAHITGTIQQTLTRLIIAARILNLSTLDILNELKPAVVGSLVMLTVTWPMTFVMSDHAPLLQLIVIITTGAISYLAALWLFERGTVQRLADIMGISQRIPCLRSIT
jgi:PST family polysaccharide transporter